MKPLIKYPDSTCTECKVYRTSTSATACGWVSQSAWSLCGAGRKLKKAVKSHTPQALHYFLLVLYRYPISITQTALGAPHSCVGWRLCTSQHTATHTLCITKKQRKAERAIHERHVGRAVAKRRRYNGSSEGEVCLGGDGGASVRVAKAETAGWVGGSVPGSIGPGPRERSRPWRLSAP